MFGRLKLVADHQVKPRPQAPQPESTAARTPAPPPESTATRVAAPQPEPPAAPPGLLGALQAPVKPSVISDAVHFVGDLSSKGAIHIDGSAKGAVHADTVTIGAGGLLDGRVNCRKLHVRGSVSGAVVCEELIISNEASVSATLTYKTLLVQRGAQVNGELFITEDA